MEEQYFQAPTRNIRIGGTLRITGRGLGVVESVLDKAYNFITQPGSIIHITDVFRVCLRFDDQQVGVRMLSSKGRLDVHGYGTYLPSADGQNWRTLF